MTSTLQTYRGAFDVLVSKLQNDLIQAQATGTTNISPEDLKTIFTLITSHSQTTCMTSWEQLQMAIKADTASAKKSRKK